MFRAIESAITDDIVKLLHTLKDIGDDPSDGTDVNILNVILVGEAGVGKSCIVNMLLGDDSEMKAAVSSSLTGCTLHSTPYRISIEGLPDVVLHDTCGLNEGSAGSTVDKDAIVNLIQLIKQARGGISLILFVVKGRLTKSIEANYELFFNHIGQSEIPMSIIINGLENEEPDMESWWLQNSNKFDKYGMQFKGHACITAIKGRKNCYEDLYQESRTKIQQLIITTKLDTPWRMKPLPWFIAIVKSLFLTSQIAMNAFSWGSFKLLGVASGWMGIKDIKEYEAGMTQLYL